jgi:phosphoserine phosphatase RsbU/P
MNSPNEPPSPHELMEDFEDFFENSPNGYLITSPEGQILRANARVANWMGQSFQELKLMSVTDLLSIGGKIYFETHLRPLLRMQGMFEEVALELVSNAGKRLPVIANALERRDEQGKLSFVRYTLFRAADRKKYEENLRYERTKAVESQKSAEFDLSSERQTAALREQFIAVLGHDLRNPLASIDAGMRMLARSELDDRSRTILGLARDSATRMAGLIDNIMDFARGRLGGGIPLDRHAVLLEPVLSHVIEELRMSNPDRRIEMDIAVPLPVLCDPGRLSQVLSNLLANALSHGLPEGPVSVRAMQYPDAFELSVTNTGPTIPEETIATLFQPYTRENVRPSQQGLGLGLYISSEIAKAHGGTLTATSEDDTTRFTLLIPAQ